MTDEFGLHLAELTLQVSLRRTHSEITFDFALGQPGLSFVKNIDIFYVERWRSSGATVGLSSLEAVH